MLHIYRIYSVKYEQNRNIILNITCYKWDAKTKKPERKRKKAGGSQASGSFAGFDSTRRLHLMLSVLGAVAQFERDLIKERQREGIALAKQRGAVTGRKKALVAERIEELRARIRQWRKESPACPRVRRTSNRRNSPERLCTSGNLSRILEKQNSLQMSQIFSRCRTLVIRSFCFSRILQAGPGNPKVLNSMTSSIRRHESKPKRDMAIASGTCPDL